MTMQGRMQLLFGCDTRSLATFRIIIGFLLIIDAFVRFSAAESFYSGEGFLDSDLAKKLSPDAYSLNYLSDSVAFQQLIFLCLGLCAFLLCVGLFTRVATLCCWVLLASIHVRNPMYVIGGDTLMRMLLFWSIFVPLGMSWSIDCWRAKRKGASEASRTAGRELVCCVGTGCLLLQVCLMYLTAGLSKLNDPWLSGIAMDYILRQVCYARPFSSWLVQFPTLTMALTYATLFIELVVPFLLFLPFRTAQIRVAAVALFWAFHLGIELSMDVGKFTYVSMAAWLLFLPTGFWDRFRWASLSSCPAPLGSVDMVLRGARVKRAARRVWLSALPAVLFLYVVFWNFAGLYGGPGKTWLDRNPDLIYRLGNATMLKQNFHMFCVPARVNVTYLLNGETDSGARVDLVRRTPAKETGPGAELPREREWKTLHWHLISFGAEPDLYEALLDYHARVWNRTADGNQQVHAARLEWFAEDIGPGISSGSFVHVPSIGKWQDPNWEMTPDEKLKQEFEQMMDRMENGGLFPIAP